jgi:hypothetical protein
MKFEITRLDGRSNAQVVLDYVRGADAGRLYPYAEICGELNKGSRKEYSVRNVRQIVAASFGRLLKEEQRVLNNVRGVGYRLAYANEHNRLALERKRRSDVQLKRGVQIVQHVRWDEMSPEQRNAHQGTLMILSAMYEQQAQMERRQFMIEQAIANLSERMSEMTKG